MNKKIIVATVAAMSLASGLGAVTGTFKPQSTVQASTMPKHFEYWLHPHKVIVTKNTKLNMLVYADENSSAKSVLATKVLKRGRVVSIYRGADGKSFWTFNPVPKDFRLTDQSLSQKYPRHPWSANKKLNDTSWFKIYTKKSAKKYRKLIKKAKKGITPLVISNNNQPKKMLTKDLPQSTIDYLNNPNISLSDKYDKASSISNTDQREKAFDIVSKWLDKEETQTPY
ncbi:hypothetical protein [uncultured Lactobacillus sp.]|uniref:hypothetical protein n=1 Tax=uncultured Lactobacillus sp. TaxID=153152 RepID=UPI00259061AC|nr:hypothetical protein [uncultured Lactobacillus sp.]